MSCRYLSHYFGWYFHNFSGRKAKRSLCTCGPLCVCQQVSACVFVCACVYMCECVFVWDRVCVLASGCCVIAEGRLEAAAHWESKETSSKLRPMTPCRSASFPSGGSWLVAQTHWSANLFLSLEAGRGSDQTINLNATVSVMQRCHAPVHLQGETLIVKVTPLMREKNTLLTRQNTKKMM